MIACQISLLPLATKDFEEIITRAVEDIKELEAEGLTIEVGSMSTVLRGKDDIVWEAVRRLFNKSKEDGQQVVLQASFSNECGCDI